MSNDTSRSDIAELMHRVKNNFQLVLSLINLQSEFTSDLPRTEASQRLMTRVHCISLVQELLYLHLRDDAAAGLEHSEVYLYAAELIDQLADYNLGLYNPAMTKAQFSAEVDECRLDSHDAISASLIFNEIILNSIVHSAKSETFTLEVQGKTGKEGTVITWLHRGVECPLQGHSLADQRLGGLLIENYSSQLGGNAAFENTGDGFLITLTYPSWK